MTCNKRYMILQGSFWMLLCVSASFISLFLQGRGLGSGAIGAVTAVFGLLSAFLQPVCGRICDRFAGLTWRRMILLLCAPFPLVGALMLMVTGAWASGILMGLLLLLVNLLMPFVNSANFYYQRRGDYIDFGVARGIGSGSYAFSALVTGRLAARFGICVVPIAGIIISGIVFVTAFFMPCEPEKKAAQSNSARQLEHAGFLRRYPAFALMLAACMVMLTSHNMTCTYLLQIIQSLGGSSEQLGVALAIQALVEVPVLFCFSAIIRRFRSSGLMLFASAGFALKAIMHAVSGGIMMIYAAQSAQMVCTAIYASASVYYAAENLELNDQMTGLALMASSSSCGSVLSGFLGGWLLETSGVKTMLAVNVGVALTGMVLAALSCRIESRSRRRNV